MNATELIKKHLEEYPCAQLSDLVKFSIHTAYGAAHFTGNEETAFESINGEFCLFDADGKAPYTEKAGIYCRIDLKCPYLREIGAKMLAALFCLSAKEDLEKANEKERLYLLSELISESIKQCADLSDSDATAASAVLEAYKNGRWEGVNHSERYKKEYSPSYRVVSEKYSRLLPVIHDALSLSKEKSPVIIAIDGPCASGKTTAAKILSEILHGETVSMDDFFLPFEKKTRERLSVPGGNTDHERFAEEIIPNLKTKSAFNYNAYSCSDGAFHKKCVPETDFIIIEGVYTMRPEFRELYDLRAWFDVSPDTQIKRLEERCPELLDRFVKEWVPMENQYFSAFKVKENCNIIIEE